MHGQMSGTDNRPLSPISLFINDEGGYTTVAMAIALLLSITLVLFAGRTQWSLSRAAEVQEVADACALSASNVVARYATCAQVCDALILSMGIAGLVTCGAGLVLSCIPGVQPVAEKTIELGTSVLESRSSFARSAVSGLSKLEELVPALVALNSIATVEANEGDGISYAGVAVPLPLEGQSDFSNLDTEIDTRSIEENASRMQDAAERVEEAEQRANEALIRGWMADCGQRPRCMRERAATLAGLGGGQNPDYPTYESWTFGAALVRARTYYPVRLSTDSPEYGTLEALVDSCARKAFYEYAIDCLSYAYYSEFADGTVDLYLPELPHNTAETRATSLYTDVCWPCTQEGDARVLHATLACPGALGAGSGYASLADIDSGLVSRCEECQMDVTDMGRVAAASTNIDNGFEHYWREVVRASRDYEVALDDRREAEEELEGVSEGGLDAFQEALELLAVPRPHIVPPGAWGCVAIVARTDSHEVPNRLGGNLLDPASLPPGVAISAAMLAPDDSAEGNSLLAHLFDGLADSNPVLFEMLGGAGSLWGALIESYDDAYEGIAESSTEFLERIDGVTGSSVGSWIRGKVEEVVCAAGLEPRYTLWQTPFGFKRPRVSPGGGWGGISQAQRIILSLGPSPDAAAILRALGMEYIASLPSSTITIAEIPIPGTGMSIPIEVDLSKLAGGP